jgi:hypothetical protein
MLSKWQWLLVYTIIALTLACLGRAVALVSPDYQPSLEFRHPDFNTGGSIADEK